MRDRLVITSIGLAIVTLVFSTVFVAGIGSSASAGTKLSSPVPAAVALIQASTLSPAPAYPTIVTQQLSSVIINGVPDGLAKGLTVNGGPGKGHAYGIAKQALSSTSTGVMDQVTIAGSHGTIPGHMDTIELQAHYNGNTTPYCTKSTTFDATGLSSYSTSFTCNYLGAGTYNFKVIVYDDNGAIIGDPMASLSI